MGISESEEVLEPKLKIAPVCEWMGPKFNIDE